MIKITVDNSAEFYQFDVNRSVIVSGLDPGVKYEFHFTTDNMDSVIVKETNTDTDGNVMAKIPNQLLTEHYPIILLIYGSHDGVTKTYYKNSLTPIARPKPEGYVLPDDDDDVKTYELLKADIEALKKAVEDLKNNGDDSGEDYITRVELEKALNLKADEKELDNKVDKLINNDTVNLIYALNTKNKMIGLRNTHGSSANSIPLRGTDHDLRVRLNPTYENEAVPKKYVDDAVKKAGGFANIGDDSVGSIGYIHTSELDEVKTPGIYIFTPSYRAGARILSVYDYVGYMQSPIVQTIYPDGLYRVYGNDQEDDSYPSYWSEWKEVDKITDYS